MTFTYHARRLGLSCRLHDLRHSHATQLLAQGVHPNVVSERLGHATVGMTVDVYPHAIQGLDEEAAGKVGAAIGQALSRAAGAGQKDPS